MPEETTTTQEGNLQTTPEGTSGSAGDAASNGTSPTFESFIPEDYKSKEWVQNALKTDNPAKAVLDMYENAQSLIGKQANQFRVPDDKATPEQLADFRKALGVPEKAEAYELSKVEWKPEEQAAGEYLTKQLNPDLQNAMKEAALSIGLSAKQFKELDEAYSRAFVKVHGPALIELQKAESEITADFEKEADQLFGTNKETVLKNVGDLVDKYATKSKPHLHDMPNKYLLMFAETIEGIRKEYIGEDAIKSGSGSTSSTNFDLTTKDGIQKAAQELRKDPAYLNPRDPRHKQAMQAVNEMYAKIAQAAK